jgi:hypothetical protein
MPAIRCLYLEDQKVQFDFLSQILKLAIKELEFERVDDSVMACTILNQRASDFQVFFADLLVPDANDPAKMVAEGLTAVKAASAYEHLTIIAISRGERSHPGISQRFKALGGHLFLDKDVLRENDYTAEWLSKTIREVLKSKGQYLPNLPEQPQVLTWKPMPGNEELDAAIETISPGRLSNLLIQAFPDHVQFVPQFVAPGYSGAMVLRVLGFKPGERTHSIDALLKCSRDGDRLRQEIIRAPKPEDRSSHIYVPPACDTPYEQNGWYATKWRFRGEATTFSSWLQQPDARGKSLQDLLNGLFYSGLQQDYHQGEFTNGKSALECLFPNIQSRARVIQSSKLLKTLIEKHARTHAKNSRLDLAIVDNFLHDSRIGPLRGADLPPRVFECVCHGDLHSRNILVLPAPPQGLLIDPACRTRRHWASDLARLCTDLWVWSWDSGPESYLWGNHLNSWRNIVLSWLYGEDERAPTKPLTTSPVKLRGQVSNRRQGTHLSAGQTTSQTAPSKVGRGGGIKITGSNLSVYQTLCWLRDNVQGIFRPEFGEECPIWEFHLALVTEFLGMSSYYDVPMPKRCLALIVAHDILDRIEHELPGANR